VEQLENPRYKMTRTTPIGVVVREVPVTLAVATTMNLITPEIMSINDDLTEDSI
jgi:hypothetical protein